MMRSYLRPAATVATLAALAAYAVIMLRGPHGLSAFFETQKAIERQQDRNDKIKREIQAHEQYIERLQTDPATQVLELRKRNFTSDGDTEFKVGGQESLLWQRTRSSL